MSKQKTSTPKLVIEETFAAADDRFVESFRSNHSPKYLASFLEKWLKDARPWSRKQLQDYLGLAWTPLGHDVVYKRIFKHFYAENDHEMMGVLMHQLDRRESSIGTTIARHGNHGPPRDSMRRPTKSTAGNTGAKRN